MNMTKANKNNSSRSDSSVKDESLMKTLSEVLGKQLEGIKSHSNGQNIDFGRDDLFFRPGKGWFKMVKLSRSELNFTIEQGWTQAEEMSIVEPQLHVSSNPVTSDASIQHCSYIPGSSNTIPTQTNFKLPPVAAVNTACNTTQPQYGSFTSTYTSLDASTGMEWSDLSQSLTTERAQTPTYNKSVSITPSKATLDFSTQVERSPERLECKILESSATQVEPEFF